MREEQRKKFLINTAYCALLLALLYILFRYILIWLLPFLFGLAAAALLNPLAKRISQKIRLPKKAASVLLILFFYAVITLLISFAGIRLFTFLQEGTTRIPALYSSGIEPAINSFLSNIEEKLSGLDTSTAETVRNIANSLSSSASSFISRVPSALLKSTSTAVAAIPRLFLGIVMSVISSVFFAADYDRITAFMLKIFPGKGQKIVSQIKIYAVDIGMKYVKGYLTLMVITFVELSFGLAVIGAQNSFIIALVIAFLDLLPVLGTGGIVIPWIIIQLLSGHFNFALKLSVLYLIITIVRNIIEPKIIGSQLGLHPLIILISMYVGAKAFGIVGMFAFPVAAVVIKQLYDSGNLPFKTGGPGKPFD